MPDHADAQALPKQVRLLGEYHRGFQASEDPDGQDIGDPLYGNANGPDEKARVWRRPAVPALQQLDTVDGSCAKPITLLANDCNLMCRNGQPPYDAASM